MMKDRFRKYFDGELNRDDEEQYRLWLCDHTDSQEVEQGMAEAFERLSEAAPHHKSSRQWLGMCIAACLLAVFIPLSFVLGHHSGKGLAEEMLAEKAEQPSVVWKEIKVPAGSVDTLLLSDGSTLFLNSGTRVTYPDSFRGGERQLFIDGEAYAQIAKDSLHPFLIRSGDASVQVLGTVFNLKSYSDARCVECLLFDGSVKMQVNSVNGVREVLMKPGNMVQYDRVTGDVSVRNFQAAQFRTLRQGLDFHFYNLTLSDITADLERAFCVKIVVLDEKLAQKRFFAIFKNGESLDKILSDLNSAGRMRISRGGETIYLSSK